MRRVLITGSRTWQDVGVIATALWDESETDPDLTVIHGGARGADTMADGLAKALGAVVEVHPADWKYSGKAAGMIRNRHMVSLGADVCLAFIRDHSRGATACAEMARQAGIPVRMFREASGS